MKIQLVNHLGSTYDADVARLAEVTNAYLQLVCGLHELALIAVRFKPGATAPDAGWVELGLFESPDVSGALGYHDVDPRGVPYGKAFLSVVPGRVMLHDPAGHGASLAGVVTHEAAEMAGDRLANAWAFGRIKDPRSKRVYGAVAWELCDPCQDAAFQMKSSDGTVVDCSDFVLPTWFNPDTPAGAKTSWVGACVGPFMCAPGGYLIVAKMGAEGQVFGRLLDRGPVRVHNDEPVWRQAARALSRSRSSRRLG